MGKGNYYSMVMVLAVLAAVTSTGNCQLSTRISQATIATTRGLTCSNPSPFIGRPVLSGANVTTTCNGATNTTTTNASGQFSLALTFPTPVTPISVTGCQVIVTMPADCTVFSFIRFQFQRITTLRSVLLVRVPGTSATFRPISFLGSA